MAFADGLGSDHKPSIAMDSLKQLTGWVFGPQYVLLLAGAKLPKPSFDHFLSQLERLLSRFAR